MCMDAVLLLTWEGVFGVPTFSALSSPSMVFDRRDSFLGAPVQESPRNIEGNQYTSFMRDPQESMIIRTGVLFWQHVNQ